MLRFSILLATLLSLVLLITAGPAQKVILGQILGVEPGLASYHAIQPYPVRNFFRFSMVLPISCVAGFPVLRRPASSQIDPDEMCLYPAFVVAYRPLSASCFRHYIAILLLISSEVY